VKPSEEPRLTMMCSGERIEASKGRRNAGEHSRRDCVCRMIDSENVDLLVMQK